MGESLLMSTIVSNPEDQIQPTEMTREHREKLQDEGLYWNVKNERWELGISWKE